MALNKRTFTSVMTTGFGEKSAQSGGRFFRKDGTANVETKGLPFFDRLSWYHTLISMRSWKFFTILLIVYLILNLVFALIYTLIGVEHLNDVRSSSPIGGFLEAFFFSTQTFTTVGFGRINPTGTATNIVASFEAFMGVLSFALASGLFYGRFSRPRSFLKFSEHAVIAPYKGGTALMFRTVPYKNNHLIDAEVKLTMALRMQVNGEYKNNFYALEPEFKMINSLSLNWTIVHPIDENSPIYGMNVEDLIKAEAELLVFLKAFDEVFSSTVVAKTSYLADEIIYGARFKPMYYADERDEVTILDLDLLNATEKAPLPQLKPALSE